MFHNFDSRTAELLQPLSRVSHLVSRAVLVDMEERVINRAVHSRMGKIFNATVTDSCGSGNNWAVGNRVMGSKHGEDILELIRRELESCDSCDGLLWSLSTGGGTGSGLGTFLLEQVVAEYPKLTQVVTAVYPSGPDDVVTWPYNTLLATQGLAEHATAILSMDNTALGRLKSVNAQISDLLVTLTAPVRTDEKHSLYDVLKPALVGGRKFLLPSFAQMKPGLIPARAFDNMFSDIGRPQQLLLSVDAKRSVSIATSAVVRIEPRVANDSDVKRNVTRLQSTIRSATPIHTSVVPSVGTSDNGSMAVLANSSAMSQLFDRTILSFDKLFKRRANLHHYTSLVAAEEFIEARECLLTLARNYVT
jgi:tubulin epsilon